MSRIVPLDAVRHRGLRVDPMKGAAARSFVQIGLSEIASAAADMPLCFAKDGETGRFNLIALLGLVEARNLFWFGGGMQATYLPKAAGVTAFRLDPDGVAGLAVDETDPAAGHAGEALFEADGAPVAALSDLADLLRGIVDDVGAARALVDVLASHKLIRPLRVKIRYEDGHVHEIAGLYGVSAEALADLDDAAVVALHRAGALRAAAVVTASLAQMERLRQLHDAASPRRRMGAVRVEIVE